MHPILFEVGGLTIYSYGVLLAAAYLLGLQFARARARARGLDAQRVMDLGIWIIISALVGAKLLLFLVDFREFTASPRDLIGLARSGGVFYGGLMAAVGVAFWYMWRFHMPVWTTTDVFAPGILLAGCCFGRPTSEPWGITFHSTVAAANVGTPLGVPLHPTQIYEAVGELMILGLLLATERRGRVLAGRTFSTYLLLYGVTRFVIEIYRGDSRGLILGVLSTSQFVSVILVPVAILMLYLLGRRPQPSPLEAARSMRAA